VRVRFVGDGRLYSLYALEFGDEHDYESFKEEQKRDRPQEMATMVQRLERLGDAGISGKNQNFNHLDDGIWEAKTRGGLRITFFRYRDCFFILDSCFAKKQAKTPRSAIDRAKARREQFLAAMECDSEMITVLVREGCGPVRVLE
jgi:phage-related protein